MASIDNLKSLINHNIGERSGNAGTKMNVYINDKNVTQQNAIFLYYTNENDWVSTSKAPYYKTSLQVAVRHNNYDKSRQIAYNCLEYIRNNEKVIAGVYYVPDSVPVYSGIDETGGYLFTFNVNLKGAI